MLLLDDSRPCHEYKPVAWDRFIRRTYDLRRRHESLFDEAQPDATVNESDGIINKHLYSSSKETYKRLLAKALSVPARAQQWSPMWPVRPRTNPCVQTPFAILDLPNIRDNFCSSFMDWSSTDYLTVAFPRSVYLWHAPKNTTLRFPVVHTTCVKWTRDGRSLFTASRNGSYKLTNMEYQNDSYVSGQCRCHLSCCVTCCSFHPFSDILIVGCSKGAFSFYHADKGMDLLFHQQDYNASITSVAFSCDGKHYAVSSLNGTVGVYGIQKSQVLFFINMAGPTRALTWHPWDRSYLVVADCLGNMSLYNILASQKLIACYTSIYNSSIVCLSFNPVSAELVVSHRLYTLIGDSTHLSTQLNVLASFDRVVDRLKGHTGRVLCMNWSPDGTRLATSGSDETARIWRFLPERKKRPSIQKESESNYTSSLIELGNRMGLALR